MAVPNMAGLTIGLSRGGCLIGGGLALLGLFIATTQPIFPQVVACDVGQGDAIMLRYGTGTVLVDVGRKQGILPCLNRNLPWGQSHIQAVILTHWDDDHIGAFSDVSTKYQVRKVISNPNTKTSSAAQAAAEAVDHIKTRITPDLGDELIFPGGRIRFLWSAAAVANGLGGTTTDTTENNRSLAIAAHFKGFGFLGLGDLECASELAVSSMPLLISTSILKISHHGSKTSSCASFIAKIKPEIALLSVGAGNSYGHPNQEVLQILRDQAVTVLRTDQLGSLEIQRWGDNWLWRSQR